MLEVTLEDGCRSNVASAKAATNGKEKTVRTTNLTA
jgi:hypothetical protein